MKICLCLLSLVGFFLSPNISEACSAFFMEGKSKWMGKSYDWHDGDGLLIVNKRNVRKRALLLSKGWKPLKWMSQFGSVTFNQYGREFPLGGINEKGLAIEILWLFQAQYPKKVRHKPTVNELQWVQYHLDTSATIDEMIKSAQAIQIDKAYADVHFFACDVTGKCATFEWVRGKPVIHKGRKLPVAALTNNTYARSVRHFRSHRGFSKRSRMPGGSGSLSRFCRAAQSHLVSSRTRLASQKKVFRTLQGLLIPGYSKWHIAYELDKKRVFFRYAFERGWKGLALKDVDFRCSTPVRVLDLNGQIVQGKRWRWTTYKTKHNQRMVQRAIQKLGGHRGGGRFPKGFVSLLARYPETFVCKR